MHRRLPDLLRNRLYSLADMMPKNLQEIRALIICDELPAVKTYDAN